MKGKKPGLSIFKTFKTKDGELTGEAIRQRSILVTLATQANPAERTRTAISQRIAEANKVIWKNIYSGIFRDLDEILIPLDLVREEGRLPLKRGPKALQEKGIPYYQLTPSGILVCLSLKEIGERDGILEEFLAKAEPGDEFGDIIVRLAGIAPKFTYSLFEKYVRSYCEGRLAELLPLNCSSFREHTDELVPILREFLGGYSKLPKSEMKKIVDFLEQIQPAGSGKH